MTPPESNANFADMQRSLGAEGHSLARDHAIEAADPYAAQRRLERLLTPRHRAEQDLDGSEEPILLTTLVIDLANNTLSYVQPE